MKQKHLAQYTSPELKVFAKEIISWSRSKNHDLSKLILNDHLKRFIVTDKPSGNEFTRIVRLTTLIKEEIFQRFIDDQFVDYVKPIDTNQCLKNFENFLNSEEGQKSTRDYVEKLEREEKLWNSYITKLHDKHGNNIDAFIDVIVAKYDSDKYVTKEYKMGREPRTPLYWLLYDYAEIHGKPCVDEKYVNDFTGGIFYIGSYVIQVMHGQGSVIRIDKIS